MGQGGVEPPTSRLSGVRSNHLSYWPGLGCRNVDNRGVPAKDRRQYVLPVPIGTPRMDRTPVLVVHKLLVLGVLVVPRIVVV